LHKIVDLGNFWEEKTLLPIPLGGIVGRRNMDENILMKVDALIKESMEYAFENYPLITDYVKQHSQEMEPEVMKKHIDLYVNNYSINLGKEGRNAIQKFMEVYRDTRQTLAQTAFSDEEIFVEEE
jgi:1,4-dihydroxy-6-naphthoate synthase